MKHIHIVEPYHSAAMQRMSEPLAELAKLYEVTTSEDIDTEADLNLHIPWHTLAGKDRGTSKHIIAYTHCNPNALPDLLDACERADMVTAMSYEGRRELVSFGVDPRKIWVNYCAPGPFRFRRRILAIVGYPQPNGRKREHLLIDMAWQYDLSVYDFLFVGTGWEDVATQLSSLGVRVSIANADNAETLQAIYGRADALLVTGYTEGGPLPLLEAMATGCKVFSPRFGYAADLLSDVDLYTDLPDLIAAMDVYFEPLLTNHMLAHSWTWQDYAAEYALLIGRLLSGYEKIDVTALGNAEQAHVSGMWVDQSVDLYPERGMSRYAQLLDVIDEVKPRSIVEIGTWNGNTAQRMIQTAAKHTPIEEVCYQGFDLFEGQTAADFINELSKQGHPKHIVQKRLDATGATVILERGYTTDTLMENVLPYADLYFIDGGHSEKTIQNDAQVVHMIGAQKATFIFDDYYHEGKPAGFGCNKVIDGLNRNEYEVTHLPARTIADDGRVIGMVKVRRHADIRLPMQETSHTGIVDDYITGNFTGTPPLPYVQE